MRTTTNTLLVLLLSSSLAGVACAQQPDGAPAKPASKSSMADARAAATRAEAQRQAYLASYTPGTTRIKDIADVQGVYGNQLVGYGLVVGLEGTGDGQQSPFTSQSALNMLRRFGVTPNVPSSQIQVKNVAAVIVTAELPPFARVGAKINLNVSSMGDAKSLQGGILIQTPLKAGNGEVYAVAQGPISIGGFNFGSGGSSVQKNHVAAGRIPLGASVMQEVPVTIIEDGRIHILLRDPDFTTASRAAAAIRNAIPEISAQATDPGTVEVMVPREQVNNLTAFISRIETISVVPDVAARIIINERTGTVAMSGAVRLAPGAVTQGAINVRIENTPVVVPPAPFNNSPGQVVQQQNTTATERNMKVAPIPSTTTIDQLVRALNALGVTPRDLISILQAMHRAGMVNAEIEGQ